MHPNSHRFLSSFSRLFGHGNGLLLAILFFFCLFILENKLNYEDEIMVMQSVWYPLLCIVPGFIVCVCAKILLYLDYLAISSFLNIPYSLLAMYGFINVGIVIPCSMINRSKKCKEFVLKKILTPLTICRNWQWIEINQKVKSWLLQKILYLKLKNGLIFIFWGLRLIFLALKPSPRCH